MQDNQARSKPWIRRLTKPTREPFSLKDKISITFAAASLVISLVVFWINVVQVKHELQASVAGVTTWLNGAIELDVAFLNTEIERPP